MNNRKTIHLICAARPNFMKVAPLYHALKRADWCSPLVVHTGQHYDCNMSDVFFQDLGLPSPEFHLGVGSGSHAEQTGQVMMAYERICLQSRPDVTLVVGDVNSTVACSLAAVKLGIKTVHLEAGLRSYDRSMPEEINRIVTDSISDLLLTPSADADENLMREGIPAERIALVGNIMIDSLEMVRPSLDPAGLSARHGVEPGRFALVTFHRPSNVDSRETLAVLCNALIRIAQDIPVLWPIHPRSLERLKTAGLLDSLKSVENMILAQPLAYKEFISLLSVARLVATDSGGIQEESTYLGVPCLTCRENTERPITITSGTNRLVTINELPEHVRAVLDATVVRKTVPPLWDGNTAQRVVDILKEFLGV